MRKIAIPVRDDKLSVHFGHCDQFYLYSVENNKVVNLVKKDPPPHEPGVLPAWLAEEGATDIIAGGMGQRAISLFNAKEVNVFVGAPEENPDKILDEFLSGNLQTQANMCSH